MTLLRHARLGRLALFVTGSNQSLVRRLLLRAKFKALHQLSIGRYRSCLNKTVPIKIVPGDSPAATVAMLCGQSSFRKGIGAAKSFYRFLPQGIPLNWHDDGSLTAEARKIIRHHLPGIRIIDRREADKKVQTYLEENGFTHLAALRKSYVHLLKFTDVPFFACGRLLQFDSDVLCLQFPAELLAALQAQDAFLSRYNRDTGPSVAFSLVDLESFLGRPILPSFNAGLMLTSVPDFKELCTFAERLLSKNFEMLEAYVLEQTLWAAWCSMQGGVPLPDVYDCSFRFGKDGWQQRERIITQHYCAFASALFFEDFNFRVYPRLKRVNHLERVIFESIRSGIFDVAK